jgi:hypothetical protein
MFIVAAPATLRVNILLTYDFIVPIVCHYKSKLAIYSAFPNKKMEERMAAQQAPAFEKGKLYNLSVTDIKPDPDQPRKYTDPQALEELTASIKQLGVLQPVLIKYTRSAKPMRRGRSWRSSRAPSGISNP